ncbi:DNA polymerase III subunit chi [Marinimicrobium agarilyticum]|uniref:DNA polymerase III subunit chi n=1 Tax=Marinimicrobium agarilyticum TaxID=306546 RepID=UPI0003FC9415|nr:DNA polymerase III subunit chi [Marinimicrobium agarilyticum]
MNRVDFYILREQTPEARWQFAGRLADKARRLGHRVLLTVDSEAEAGALDEFLWAHPEDSFLPHRLINDNALLATHIEIAPADRAGHTETHNDVLINLGRSVPEGFERFDRLAEIVIQSDEVLKSTREHFSFYKARGYPVHHQQL